MGFNTLFQEISSKNYNNYYIGCSGGIDSMLLLHHCLKFFPKDKLIVIHVDHQIHSKSQQYAQFVEKACLDLDIKFVVEQVKIEACAIKDGLENAARIARYNAFAKHITKQDCLLLAHHQDDQIETVVMRLFRGSGILGLKGIEFQSNYQNKFDIYRPFLFTSKEEISKISKLNHIIWVEDPTNKYDSITRNFLRNNILHNLFDKYPAFQKGIIETISTLKIQSQLYEEFLYELYTKVLYITLDNEYCLDLKNLDSLAAAKKISVISYWLNQHNILIPSKKTLEIIVSDVVNAKHDKQPKLMIGKNLITKFNQYLYCIDVNSYGIDLTNECYLNEIDKVPAKLHTRINLKEDFKVCFLTPNQIVRVKGETISRKMKYIFQKYKVPPWKRLSTPLLFVNNNLVAIGCQWIAIT